MTYLISDRHLIFVVYTYSYMPETTDSDKISWEVPEGFCLGETINGAKILLPEFVMEASKQQFAAYRKVVGYDVYSAAGGVSFNLPHLQSTAFGYTFPFGHKVCDRPQFVAPGKCSEPAKVFWSGQTKHTCSVANCIGQNNIDIMPE